MKAIKRLLWIAAGPVILYFLFGPHLFLWLVGAYFVLGLLDVKRNSPCDRAVIRSYFTGSGTGTWALSPFNFLFDLFAIRNSCIYTVEDFPQEVQNEIRKIIHGFDKNRDAIMARVGAQMDPAVGRGMLFYKWFGRAMETDIEAFNQPYRFIKTIGVSCFNKKSKTSWHYGPLRLTVRLLYNFSPVQSRDAYIDIGRRRHYWMDNPILIFDDTLRHQSVNETEGLRYCAFIDILRPSYLHRFMEWSLWLFSRTEQLAVKSYKSWRFLK